MICCGSGDGTPQSCTSAIPEMDFAFGSNNPTDVSQLAPLGMGVSIWGSLTENKKADIELEYALYFVAECTKYYAVD